MKLYAIEVGVDYEGYSIEKMFLNKENAEKWYDENKDDYLESFDSFDIEVYETED